MSKGKIFLWFIYGMKICKFFLLTLMTVLQDWSGFYFKFVIFWEEKKKNCQKCKANCQNKRLKIETSKYFLLLSQPCHDFTLKRSSFVVLQTMDRNFSHETLSEAYWGYKLACRLYSCLEVCLEVCLQLRHQKASLIVIKIFVKV